MILTYIDTVILGICLLKGAMDRGCVNNGIRIIRTLQRVCSKRQASEKSVSGRNHTRFAVHYLLSYVRYALFVDGTGGCRAFDSDAPFHETIQSLKEQVIDRTYKRKHWLRTCIYFVHPHISLGLVHQVEQTSGQTSTVFLSVLGIPKEGRGR